MDGNVKSVKLYLMVALGIASFVFRWFDRIDTTTLTLLLTPTLIAYLKLHVDQQKARMAAKEAE